MSTSKTVTMLPGTLHTGEVWPTGLATAHSAVGQRRIGQALSAKVSPEGRSDAGLSERIVHMADATPGAAFEGRLAALASRPSAWETLRD